MGRAIKTRELATPTHERQTGKRSKQASLDGLENKLKVNQEEKPVLSFMPLLMSSASTNRGLLRDLKKYTEKMLLESQCKALINGEIDTVVMVLGEKDGRLGDKWGCKRVS